MSDYPWKTYKDFYDLHASEIFKKDTHYHVGMKGKSPEDDIKNTISQLNLKEKDFVVDLGCGSGYLTHEISKLCKSVGMSNSEGCIRQAKTNYPENEFILASMDEFYIEDVTHMIAIESIGYSNIDKTFRCVRESLVDGGIFFIKDITLISKPNDKEMANIQYWENYWKYYTLNVPDMISTAYRYGFKLNKFLDISFDENTSIKPFLDTLALNLSPQIYPYPEHHIVVLTEFTFEKEKRKEWEIIIR
jgi:cyclopropane fatty-acyl-phospholipid synthase-like methyltransferase